MSEKGSAGPNGVPAAGTTIPASDAMKGAEGTPEEQERLAVTNNNGSLNGKIHRPKPHSVFRSTRVFMFVFLSGWVMQGMFFTYFVGVITTVEKFFRIESTTTGTLLSATEIGQICTSLFLTYLAGRGHRPRWIACMMLVLALGVLGCVVPHILYGNQLLDFHLEAHNGTEASMCIPNEHNKSMGCDASLKRNNESHSSITKVVIPWLFGCLLVVGIGQTGITTLGIPYVDDNVGSRQSPLYMAITIGIRVIGPALGFLLGAFCTRVYVDPFEDPGFDASDPRWVGAWWLGSVLVASVIVLLSMMMFCFPKQIKKSPGPPPLPTKTADTHEPFYLDFWAAIKRQLTNDILMCRTASSVLHLMPISGLYSFLPKYLETQFKLSSYDANLVSGFGGILVMGMGIITAGVIILKLVPTARQVAGWTAFTALVYSVGMVFLMFVRCEQEQFAPFQSQVAGQSAGHLLEYAPGPTHIYNETVCFSLCNCTNARISTVCGQDGLTYISACHAGCTGRASLSGKTVFYDCRCIRADSTHPAGSALTSSPAYSVDSAPLRHNALNINETWMEDYLNKTAKNGVNWGYGVAGDCHGGCERFKLFLVIFAALMFIHASGEVGSVLLIIRCTDPRDKAMAMGVIQFAIGLFGNVPCPIIFGRAVDAACRVRDVICGHLAGCALYDNDKFRHYYLGLTGGIMFLAFIMDLAVWSKASRIDMNPEESAGTPHMVPDSSTQPLALTAPPPDTQL